MYSLVSSQNINFDDFKRSVIIEEEEEKDEGVVHEDDVDTSPWAGSDRDYSYEEVCGKGFMENFVYQFSFPVTGTGVQYYAREEPHNGWGTEEKISYETTTSG